MTSVLLVLTLAASPVLAADAPADRSHHACVALEVRPSDAGAYGGRRSWRAREVVDLEFRGKLTGAAASQGVELRVLTPAGHLYQSFVVATDEVRRPRAFHATPRGRVRRVRDRLLLATMPVAGTSVTQRGLFGRWTVAPHFSRDPEPCGHAASFELLP